MRPGPRVLAIAVCLALLAGRDARADDPAPPDAPALAPDVAERAAVLKKRGDEAMDSLHYEDALAAYSEAYALAKDPALLYNRGRVLQARSDYPAALEAFEQFARDAPPAMRARVPKLQQLLAEIRSKVAKVEIVVNVAGARVSVRERPAGTAPLATPLALNAGPATVEVAADGYAPYRREVDLVGGETTRVDVALVAARPDGDVLAASAPVQAARPREDQAITSHWWFWTAVGAAVVGGAVVTVALLKEKNPGTGESFQPGQLRGPLVATW
jgi:tetratricopeptide (TPR) repeat protein